MNGLIALGAGIAALTGIGGGSTYRIRTSTTVHSRFKSNFSIRPRLRY